MQTAEHIAWALRKVADHVADKVYPIGFNKVHWIRDSNGNRVGTFKLEQR
jgi:hypothetical protein